MPPSPYSVHPSIRYAQAVVAGMKDKTGRSIDEWIALVRKSGPKDDAARVAWLKAEHKLGTNYASWVAERAAGRGQDDTDADAYLRSAPRWVEAMYSGKKAALRPIHDRLVTLGRKLGRDVRVCPCQTIVPLFREHVFAEVKPATNSRIDLSLCLRGLPRLPKRLIPTGDDGRLTHRIPISTLDEIDAEVERWYRAAYENSAPEKGRKPAYPGRRTTAR